MLTNETHPQAVALFSGGLDSILAARLVTDLGLDVHCLHFYSPFFGFPNLVPHWEEIYGLRIEAVDAGDEFVEMLRQGAPHGIGKIMNPCVDCKILMMRRARMRMAELGASFIISGEVLGQRPMSQRRDTLNVIRRDGGVHDILLRPLCAQHLEPTEPELSGLVDRSRLLGMFGRGRREQLDLAKKMGLTEIPTPGGGCRLTEKENARRYWPVLTQMPASTAADFYLANIGRQFWHEGRWLVIGRNEADNQALERCATPTDTLIKVLDVPGPLGLARGFGNNVEALREAAACTASYSPKAVRLQSEVDIRLTCGEVHETVRVTPCRETSLPFNELSFESVRDGLKERQKAQGIFPYKDNPRTGKQQSEKGHARSTLAACVV